MDSRAIRDAFTGFFADKGHAHVDSGPLGLRADPTLMFANASYKSYRTTPNATNLSRNNGTLIVVTTRSTIARGTITYPE